MLDTNTILMVIILVAISTGFYFLVQRSNQEISVVDESSSVNKILIAIRQLNSRLETLEKKYALDQEQTVRSRKNIYDTLGMQIEARKLDNIAVTGLLDRHAGLTGTTLPAPH